MWPSNWNRWSPKHRSFTLNIVFTEWWGDVVQPVILSFHSSLSLKYWLIDCLICSWSSWSLLFWALWEVQCTGHGADGSQFRRSLWLVRSEIFFEKRPSGCLAVGTDTIIIIILIMIIQLLDSNVSLNLVETDW